MDQHFTVTFTLTKDEMFDLCAALHDSTSYWYKHLRNARTMEDYFLTEKGSTLVYEQRTQMYRKFNDVYHETFETDD